MADFWDSLFGGGNSQPSIPTSKNPTPSFGDSFSSALGSAIPSTLLSLGSYFLGDGKRNSEASATQLARDQFEFEKSKFGQLSAYQQAQLDAAKAGGGGGGAGDALEIAKRQLIARAIESQMKAALEGRAGEANSLVSIAQILQKAIGGR